MRDNKSILRILTANGDYIKWLGLIQSNITQHDLLNVIAITTMAEYVNDIPEEQPHLLYGAPRGEGKFSSTNYYILPNGCIHPIGG